MKALSIAADDSQTSDAATTLDQLNRVFCAICEIIREWNLLHEPNTAQNMNQFRTTQWEFHEAGSKLLKKLSEVGEPNGSQPGAESFNGNHQLKFGTFEDSIVGNANNTTKQTEQTGQKDDQMVVDETNDTVDGHSVKPSTSSHVTTMSELKEAVTTALKCTNNRAIDFHVISYELHAQLFAEVFKLQPMKESVAYGITKIIQTVEKTIAKVKEMGFRLEKLMVRLFIMHVIAVIDPQSRDCWDYHVGSREPTIEDMLNFLARRHAKYTAEAKSYTIPKMESGTGKRPSRSPAPTTSKGDGQRAPSAHGSESMSAPKKKKKPEQTCYICPEVHRLHECPKFEKLSFEARESTVVRLGLCKNCFDKKHTTLECPRPNVCKNTKCSRKHSTKLYCL